MYAASKEVEIRDVCSSNYQEFVDSIEEIVRMKSDVANLQVLEPSTSSTFVNTNPELNILYVAERH